jgi:hypothetical protein
VFGGHLDHVYVATAAAAAPKLSQANPIVGAERSGVGTRSHRSRGATDYNFRSLFEEFAAVYRVAGSLFKRIVHR